VNVYGRQFVEWPAAVIRRAGPLSTLAALGLALALMGALAVFLCWRGIAGQKPLCNRIPGHAIEVRTVATKAAAAITSSDRFGDGTPDFLRLSDPADQAAFRRWFTLIAEYQTIRPRAQVPSEITDCAGLLRYAYREALKRHDENWFQATGIEVAAPPGEIRAWSYPHTPLGTSLFRVKPGAFQSGDLAAGAFAQFADAKTLVERNAYLVGRDVQAALPGDLLFYRQFGQSSPWHSMIVIRNDGETEVVYDTGSDQGQTGESSTYRKGPEHENVGELRRVLLSELVHHPQPQWRPVPGNTSFLGVYRWNILRGTP
jgi:uncharacterized protein